MNENEISYKIIGASISIHKSVGPGLLESAYEAALAFELKELGMTVERQAPMPFYYKEIKQDIGYRSDLIVNNRVIVEVKSVESLAPVHYSQLLTYLKVSNLKLGLLINFNTILLKNSIHRIVNKL